MEQPHDGSVPRRGRLRIFFGYADGVGKTTALLTAACREARAGRDVVVGWLAPNPPISPQPLEQLPQQGGELDLDAALRRRPALLVVDQLGHENPRGSRHRWRSQDVEELLHAGVDVYTTLNVGQLESLSDLAAAITGAPARHRVPDRVFDSADQVELVDREPEELAAHPPRQEPELSRLAALREMALRRAAGRLNQRAEDTDLPLVAGEHILICLSGAPSNAKVIRTAARMAKAFHSGFTALFVETPQTRSSGQPDPGLLANLRLAEDLGARIATVYGEDVAVQIAEYARAASVSKVVIGRSNNRRGILSRRKNLVDRLTQLAPNLDVYIIPDNQPPYQPGRPPAQEREAARGLDLLKALTVLCFTSGIGMGFYILGLSEANIITVYILGVLITSLWTSNRTVGGLASLASITVFNYLFTAPRFTLRVYDPRYTVTFLVMFIASFITSTLTMQVKKQARQAAQKAYRTQVLFETSQLLQKAETSREILEATARQMTKLLERTVLLYPVADGALGEVRVFPGAGESPPFDRYLTPGERQVAQWVCRNNKRAGATTNTLPEARCLYLAVRGQQGVYGVAGIPMDERRALDAFGKNLLIAMLGECGIALEKAALTAAKQEVELRARQELLRANLLRAISHDLRTPLTSISGNAAILMERSAVLEEEKKTTLYTDIYEDAQWLMGLVENLLSITRIENGAVEIHTQPELLDEVFHESLQHLDRRREEHLLRQQLEDDLLMARMDPRLISQVITNLVGNAIKYTQPGSEICLSACRKGPLVEVSVADNGPGIPADAKEKLFEMFYTAGNSRGDGRRGLGLGLALCRSIVTAHGGTIWVEDNHPTGAVFTFTLQAAEVESYE